MVGAQGCAQPCSNISNTPTERLENRELSANALSAPAAPEAAELESPTMQPFRNSMQRLARAAISALCETMMTVCPLAASCSSIRKTFSLFSPSSAPVGSSAKITGPPFISARAIATRCSSPPDRADGRCCARSSRPSRERIFMARWRRGKAAAWRVWIGLQLTGFSCRREDQGNGRFIREAYSGDLFSDACRAGVCAGAECR